MGGNKVAPKGKGGKSGKPAAPLPPIALPALGVAFTLILLYFCWSCVAWGVGSIVLWLSVLAYIIPWFIYSFLLPPQDLKAKYQTEWALVTGGSSGIGRAIATRLAKQGLNVILVAYPDDLLQTVAGDLSKEYKVTVRPIGLDLASPDAAAKLWEDVKDIDIGIVFSNAGFIVTGLTTQVAPAKLMANYHCNATASYAIATQLIAAMQKRKRKGCCVFTSSPAAFMVSPFAVMYGATKAFITEFAISIAPEVKPDGIDICVVHPSPTDTNFYQGTGNLSVLENFKATAVGPDIIAEAAFRTVGRLVVCDQGWYSFWVRFGIKFVDANLVTEISSRTLSFMPDYKAMKAQK